MRRKRDFTWDTGWSPTGFSRLVHQVSGRLPSAPGWAGETAQPPMDIFEDDKGITVQIEVPGMIGKNLSVRLDPDRLTIEGYKHSEHDRECLRYLCVEREFGLFRRIVELSASVNASGATAVLADGVLVISIPRVAERRRSFVDVAIEE